MKIKTLAVGIIIFLTFVGGYAHQKESNKLAKEIKYKVLVKNVTTKNSSKRINLIIYFKPKNFKVNKLIALVNLIKNDYAKFDEIAVAITDTKKLSTKSIPHPIPMSDWKTNKTRGFYEYNKRENKGELSFTLLRNKKKIEILINFQENQYCVSEFKDEK